MIRGRTAYSRYASDESRQQPDGVVITQLLQTFYSTLEKVLLETPKGEGIRVRVAIVLEQDVGEEAVPVVAKTPPAVIEVEKPKRTQKKVTRKKPWPKRKPKDDPGVEPDADEGDA